MSRWILAVVLVACGGDKGETGDTSNATGTATGATTGTATGGTGDSAWPANTADAISNYANIVHASYVDSRATAQTLDASLSTFTADPTPGNHQAAKQAWLDSREPYLQTEVYRFYDGPIDNAEDGPEGLLNAWPLDEQAIDYVEGMPNSGIVNDPSVTIDLATLEGLNEEGGEKNITTGYHAIEFLLWGQDLASFEGAGERPGSDYADGGTAANQDRRRAYLDVSGDLLVQHLQQLEDAWAPGAAYRTGFEGDAEASFGSILTGMIVLSGFETGGERLQAALDSGDREDEHSCFSDNTHRDMIQDIQGIQNVWLGSYTAVDGTMVSGVGIRDVVAEVDAALADQVTAQIEESLGFGNALVVPFEDEIAPGSDGNARVQAVIDSLRAQEGLLEDVFVAFGLSIPVPE
jgi:putative iron-regulated protein